MLLYRQEVPYSCEVIVEEYKHDPEKPHLIKISATIYVGRKTQKTIIIGKDGSMIKKLGTEARKEIEIFTEKKIYLDLHVKVKEDWRDDEQALKHFGYHQ